LVQHIWDKILFKIKCGINSSLLFNKKNTNRASTKSQITIISPPLRSGELKQINYKLQCPKSQTSLIIVILVIGIYLIIGAWNLVLTQFVLYMIFIFGFGIDVPNVGDLFRL